MIKVLVVEDDRVAAEAHQLYVQRVTGFEVVGVVHSCAEALRFCKHNAVDVILLDFFLPDIHGLNVCRALRAAGSMINVIAVTSARDLTVVGDARIMGVVDYLLKPFAFDSLRDKLEHYAKFHQIAKQPGQVGGQADVDRMLNTSRNQTSSKGITDETLQAITAALNAAAGGLSSTEAANIVGVSRVTAQRYLKYLVKKNRAQSRQHHGPVGRPEIWYYPAAQDGGTTR